MHNFIKMYRIDVTTEFGAFLEEHKPLILWSETEAQLDKTPSLSVKYFSSSRRIILNNPKKRNALSLSMLESLRENILTDVDSDDLRVIIISGSYSVWVYVIKTKHASINLVISACVVSQRSSVFLRTRPEGADVDSGQRVSHKGVSNLFRGEFLLVSPLFLSSNPRSFILTNNTPSLVFQVMTLIQDIPVPVIAMVNGVATAAGCQLVASCDVAVVTEKSTFATPGVNVGLFCSTPAVAIGRAVPRKVRAEHTRLLQVCF